MNDMLFSKQVFATIITIGDELLIGQVVDTNSAFIAQQLNGIGIHVRQRQSVGDVWKDIWESLEAAGQQSKVVIITGGLGPTADDITKPLLCDFFGGTMQVDYKVLAHVKEIFNRLNRPIIDRNLKQAEVPDVCTVLHNSRGTAPGMWFEKKGIIYISLPGVPHEMKGLMKDEVLPKLKAQLTLPAIVHQTLLTAGIGESFLAESIAEWENKLPQHIKLAYLPNYGMVRLRLSGHGADKTTLEHEVAILFNELQTQVAQWLVTNRDETMEETLGQLLQKVGATLATAESCTGGYIAYLMSHIPGSSAHLAGGIISYSNDVKKEVLGVNEETLTNNGAVSQPVVEEMANGVLQQTNASVAIAVSGIMGPDGGTEDKPVGTVWMAVGRINHIISKKMHFRFDRERNIQLTALYAMNMLREYLIEELR